MQIKRMLCLLKLLDEFADVFDEKPGLCNEGVHEIHVTPDLNLDVLGLIKCLNC